MSEAVAEEKPAIAAAIIVQDGKLMLVQRRVSEGSLSWQFPGGAVEPGETFEQAAVRETAEEAGLTVQAVKDGEAYVADAEELADIVWATPDKFTDYVPYGFTPAVQDYLTATLA